MVEFARMKPVELLGATEKAIGNAELAEQHEELIVKKRELVQAASVSSVVGWFWVRAGMPG